MRSAFLILIGVVAVGCGGRTPLFDKTSGDDSTSDASTDATVDGEVVGDGGDISDGGGHFDPDANSGRGTAPIPVCTGKNSTCVQNDAGLWEGAALINCKPVSFIGPWTLLLEREVTQGQFHTVQVQTVDRPGFGAIFQDDGAPVAQVTYRVCVVDDSGTRCGGQFTTSGPPNCACVPYTCGEAVACNQTIYDLCGHFVRCGACSNGNACNAFDKSCCPDGKESDGSGACVCAPPEPCGKGEFWNVAICACEGAGL